MIDHTLLRSSTLVAMPAADPPFAFECPLSFFEKADEEAGKQRRIGGVMSSESRDRQGETILQRGLDFGDFLTNGWFNDNHTKDTDGVLGFPESVRQYARGQILPDGTPAKTNCTWVEGYMLADYDKADRIWRLGQSLQQTGRRLGFSVEGSILRRQGPDDSIIAKAKVRNCAITNCFPGDTIVVGAGRGLSRRMYAGDMIELVLAHGHKLTGTPNHPVFTQRGWVPLHAIDERSDRVACSIADTVTGAGVPDDKNHVPTRMDDAFAAAEQAGTSFEQRRGVVPDFHGDGRDGQVDVVALDGQLRNGLQAAFTQAFGQDVLPTTDKLLATLHRRGSDGPFALRDGRASAGDVGGHGALFAHRGAHLLRATKLLGVPTACNTGAGHQLVHPFATHAVLRGNGRADGAVPVCLYDGSAALRIEDLETVALDAPAPEQSADGGAANADSASDAGRPLARQIRFHDVRRKRRIDYCGHVYNLDTTLGWYSAGGILARNCPVNTDARLEILARSLAAIEAAGTADQRAAHEVEKMMTVGGARAPLGVETTGAGAGAILGEQDLERPLRNVCSPQPKSRRARKSFRDDGQAVDWIQARFPNLPTQAAVDFVRLTKALERHGYI